MMMLVFNRVSSDANFWVFSLYQSMLFGVPSVNYLSDYFDIEVIRV